MDNKEILEKIQNRIAISNFEKEDMDLKKYKILNMVATIAICIGITTGLVYAGNKVYEKKYEKINATVYNNPKEFNSYEEYLQYNKKQIETISKKAKINKKISMEESENIAIELLYKLGYENIKFTVKEFDDSYNGYKFATNKDMNKGTIIIINAENGKLVGMWDEDYKYKSIISDNLTEDQVKEKANEIYKIIGLEENEYKLKDVSEKGPWFYKSEIVVDKYWEAIYCKTYDGAFNRFERVEIRFLVENGKIRIINLGILKENIKFENNPVIIDKQDAEKIALEKDKNITDNEVDFIVTNLQIRQVNSWIYLLEKYKGKYPEDKKEILANGEEINYKPYEITENVARKVWTVSIHYKKDNTNIYDEKYNTKNIFVDVTTGEVVGGSDESYWEHIK